MKLMKLMVVSIIALVAIQTSANAGGMIPSPAMGYLEAHKGVKNPMKLLGGPIDIEIEQKSGGVFVALPDKRKLDPNVFGTPEHPRAFGGTPGINGVPIEAREVENGKYVAFKKMSPFGDRYIVLPNGKLRIKAHDETATDAATTKDRVDFVASWEDKDGNVYEVRSNMVAPHGVEYPTFGGVVTNHILHGFTRIGTALMPSEFTYFAFWGMGTIWKNGKKIDGPRPIHGMLTEYVRKKGYKLAFDNEVTPTRLQFHLMIPPFVVDPNTGKFVHKPVKTGFKLPNGMELPFWHVMFENLTVNASR